MRVSIFDAEVSDGHGWRTIGVPPGTEVALGEGWIATITQAAINCDCGKGVYCPLNPQHRMEI